MLQRVTEEGQAINSRNKSYFSTSVCPGWHNYQLFAKWYINYISGLNIDIDNNEDMQIDKDILQWNQQYKVYSPGTCCIIPGELNLTLSGMHIAREKEAELPIGVQQAQPGIFIVNNYYDGTTYNNPMDAFNRYKEIKTAIIRDMADKYFNLGLIYKNIYDALYNLKILPYPTSNYIF